MKNTLAFVAALALTVAGVGWYLGWFQVRTTPGTNGHETVNIDVNTEKVYHDLHEGEDEVLSKTKQHIEDMVEKSARDFPPPSSAKEPGQDVLPGIPGLPRGDEPRVPLNIPTTPH
jgi:hypothetical protein